MKVISIAQVPPPTIQADASVSEALVQMEKIHGGACVVLEESALVGMFSERDLMLRVIKEGSSLAETPVREVMTEHLSTIAGDSDSAEALSLMLENHIRHLPVVNEDGRLAGLLSMRSLMQHHVEELTDQLNSIVAYFSVDGPGG